jgi:hypothetical protein
MLSLENVRAHAATYIVQENRMAQDAYWMYEFLRDSLMDAARICLSVESMRYIVNGREDGPSYLKALLIKFHVETNATNFHLKESLSLLPNRMKGLKSNVVKFNDIVSSIIVDLAAGGETSSNLIVYVFQSYLSIEDQEFKRYIQNKKEKYDKGNPAITAQNLMTMALTKYNQLVQSKTWKAKSPEEEKLIALTAQLKAAKDKIDELSKQKKKTSPTMSEKKDDSPAKSSSPNKKSANKSNKYPDWKFERTGNQTTMERNSKTYHWCENHGEKGMWVTYAPKDCKTKKQKSGNKTSKEKGSASNPSALSIAKVLVAISVEEA